MVDIVTEIQINKPISIVSAYAANPDNALDWYENIKSVEWRTPKPLSVGTRVAFVAHFLGRKLEYVYKVTAYLPNSTLVMQTSQGPFPMQAMYSWKQISPSATLMTFRNTGSPSGFSKLFAPFMQMAMRKANQKDLNRLKKNLEMTGQTI